MPISHKKKILFVHIPKNAGTSISLISDFGFSQIQHQRYNIYRKNHPLEWENYLKVAIVRNPWDRFVSCYEYARMSKSFWHSNVGGEARAGPHPDYQVAKDLDFDTFTRKFFQKEIMTNHYGWIPQYYWICEEDKIVMDKVFKLEDIHTDESFKEIFGPVEKINTSNKMFKSYKDYYENEETKKMVEQLYLKDVQIFNYSF